MCGLLFYGEPPDVACSFQHGRVSAAAVGSAFSTRMSTFQRYGGIYRSPSDSERNVWTKTRCQQSRTRRSAVAASLRLILHRASAACSRGAER